jgi:hypothetical protein
LKRGPDGQTITMASSYQYWCQVERFNLLEAERYAWGVDTGGLRGNPPKKSVAP